MAPHKTLTGAFLFSRDYITATKPFLTVKQIREAARRLHAAGIEVGFFLQFGYPGETRADIEATFQLVRDCRPDHIGASVSYPMPGTRFYEAVRARLGARQNWLDSDDLAMLYAGPYSTAFYRALHRALHKEFRARKAWDALRGAARRPATLRRHLREAGALAYHAATLPFTRLRVEHLARLPHEGIAPLPPDLTPAEAATPTPF